MLCIIGELPNKILNELKNGVHVTNISFTSTQNFHLVLLKSNNWNYLIFQNIKNVKISYHEHFKLQESKWKCGHL